jgi:dolichyl-phosphate-mannose-protein mannosyltransferase
MRESLVRLAPAGHPRLSPVQRIVVGRANAAASGLAILAALTPIAIYIWIAVHRLGYPYELDWLEGGAVELVGRVFDGKSLYTAPTLAYVSYTYPPLYTWVAAAVAELTGLGFLPLRLVSFASSLVAFVALWRWVVAATADRVAGIVAVGLFAASYGLSGWWFDVGRLDSMFLALTLVTLWLGRRAQGVRGGLAVGVIGFLAFFTKQSALVAVLPALAWLALVRPRAGVAALVALIGLVAGSTLLLDAVTGGWYRYYVVSELTGQPWRPHMWVGFWRIDLYDHLRLLTWLLACALALTAALAWRGRGSARPRALPTIRLPARGRIGVGYELTAAVGMLLAAWFSRLHTGGFANVLMPAYAAGALLGGVAFAKLRQLGPLPALVAAALVLVQLAQLTLMPDHALPAKAQRTAGNELISRLRALPGPVLVLAHPWYGTLAGKGSFAQADALAEVLRSDAPRGATDLRRALRGSLNRYDIRAVVLDKPPQAWLAPQLAHDFVLEPGPITRLALRPPADLRSTPTLLYVRKLPRQRHRLG